MPGAGAGCCELAVRVVATGYRRWAPVQGRVPVPGAGAGCGGGGGCYELAVRVVEAGCRCWVPVQGAAWWRQGAVLVLAVRVVETGCPRWVLVLAVRVVETGCRCWLCVWWRVGAGAGCWVLAVRVAETGCWCWVPVLGAGAGCTRRGGDRVLAILAYCGAADFWSDMVAHALIPKLWVWLVELEHPYALVPEDAVALEFDKVSFPR